MPDGRDPDPKEPGRLFSSDEVRAMMEEFRDLVQEGIVQVTPENQVLPGGKSIPRPAGAPVPAPSGPSLFSEEGVKYFNRRLSERLERSRESAASAAHEAAPKPRFTSRDYMMGLREEVVARAARRLLDEWDASRGSLREALIEQLIREILERMDKEQG
jgi:hypothetical protein